MIIGDRATKARLTELGAPPRVVHLATHGFYRAGREPADRPLLLSGIAFAGANRALHDPDQGGILYAIEALDLNLEGTELVVLSACERRHRDRLIRRGCVGDGAGAQDRRGTQRIGDAAAGG